MSEYAKKQSETSRFARDLVEIIEIVSTGGINTAKNTEHYPKELTKKLETGEPILDFDIKELDDRAAQKVIEGLLSCFREHFPDKADSLDTLASACQNGGLFAEKLLGITLGNCWSELGNIAHKSLIDLDLLQLFTLYLARPFRQQMAEQMTAGVDLSLWQQGYCPVCGHSPVLGSILGKEGQRWLWCCCCNTRWRFARIQCPFCMNQSQEKLGYLSLEGVSDYRIYICDQCRRYLKEIVRDSDENDINFHYDKEYLTSAYLDEAALAQGYISEPIWINRYAPPGAAGPEVCSESKEI